MKLSVKQRDGRKRRCFERLEQRRLLAADVLTVPYFQDFSAGVPTDGWAYFSSNDGRIQIVDGGLQMDDARPGGSYSYNEAVMRVDLAGLQDVRLRLRHTNINDELHLTPETYTGRRRGDAISISDDGVTWYRLVSLDRSFVSRSFSLDQAVLAAGMQYTSDFLIRIQQFDNYSANSDGRSFDNIEITGVKPAAIPRSLPYEIGFSGTIPGLEDGWQLESTNSGRIEVVDGSLIMDSSQSGVYSLNTAMLHLDLAGETGVQLELSHANHNDENHALPAQFVDQAFADGISFSVDGKTWHGLASLTSSFNDASIDLDAAFARVGIEYTNNVRLLIQQYDNYGAPTDGRSFDDIRVTAALLPTEYTIHSDLNGFVDITGAQLDSALRAIRPTNNGLLGHGQAFVDVARRLNINPLYIAAHAAWETGWGTSRIFKDKNNAFGYGAYDRCPYSCALSFNTVEEGVEFAMGKVKENYLTLGGKYYHGSTLAGMNVRYATDPNWKYGIASIMTSLISLLP